jgi:hypothetical protein
MRLLQRMLLGVSITCGLAAPCLGAEKEFVPLFPEEGEPKGWVVKHWSDVAKAPPEGAAWKVEKGVLHGSTPRGTWLVSEQLYGDFVLDFDFKLGDQGNSGVGIRFPDAGDPAFDGLELQIVDPRYYGNATDIDQKQLTGSLYLAAAPKKQIYKPGEWNHYEITCQGAKVKVVLNGEVIQDVNLDEQTAKLEKGSTLKERPRRGHIGFQELSRGKTHVLIRNAKIKILD